MKKDAVYLTAFKMWNSFKTKAMRLIVLFGVVWGYNIASYKITFDEPWHEMCISLPCA